MISDPILKLNSILVSLIPKKSYELTEEVIIILTSYARMLDRCELLTDAVKDFAARILFDLREPDPIVRRNILEVSHFSNLSNKILDIREYAVPIE